MSTPQITPDPTKTTLHDDDNADSAHKPKKPPDSDSMTDGRSPKISRRRLSVTFANEVHYSESPTSSDPNSKNNVYTFFPPPLATAPTPDLAGLGLKNMQLQTQGEKTSPTLVKRAKSDDQLLRSSSATLRMAEDEDDNDATKHVDKAIKKPENFMLGFLWLLYLSWMARASM